MDAPSLKKRLSPVRGVTGEPNPKCVALLESLLADARAGEFTSIVCCYQGPDGASAHAWALNDDLGGVMIYELEAVKLRLLVQSVQDDE